MKLSNLFNWYKEQREWRKLSKNSKIMYDQMMKHALAKFPIMDRVDYITAKTADELYDELLKTGKTSTAVFFTKVMRRIWNVAKRHGKVKVNPFEKMGVATLPSRTTIWSPEVVHQFSTKALELNLPHISLLVEMCYNLGQRPSDVIAIKIRDYNKTQQTVKVYQSKTKKTVFIPIYEPFITKLNRYVDTVWSKRWGTFLPQFNYSQYNRDYRLVRDKLGLPKTLQLRDLRRTAITEIMEHGATDAEGQAVSGHTNRNELNTYAPSTLTMARNAMEKRFNLK
jgi:integrase